MKNVYVFCSFAVIMLVMAVSLLMVHFEIRDLKQEVSDSAELQEQQLEQQNLRMELVESSLERVHDALAADEYDVSDSNAEAMRDAVAAAQSQEHSGSGTQESSAGQPATGYDIRLVDNVIYVYAAGGEEPLIKYPVSEGYLTKEQTALLESGIHIEDMQEVYHLLESYSS